MSYNLFNQERLQHGLLHPLHFDLLDASRYLANTGRMPSAFAMEDRRNILREEYDREMLNRYWSSELERGPDLPLDYRSEVKLDDTVETHPTNLRGVGLTHTETIAVNALLEIGKQAMDHFYEVKADDGYEEAARQAVIKAVHDTVYLMEPNETEDDKKFLSELYWQAVSS